MRAQEVTQIEEVARQQPACTKAKNANVDNLPTKND